MDNVSTDPKHLREEIITLKKQVDMLIDILGRNMNSYHFKCKKCETVFVGFLISPCPNCGAENPIHLQTETN